MVRILLTMPYFSSDYDQRNVGLKYDVKHIKSEDMIFAELMKLNKKIEANFPIYWQGLVLIVH